MCGITKREYPLLGAALLFISSCATESHIKTVSVQCLLQSLGFHHVGMNGAAVIKGVDVLSDTFGVDMHDEVHTAFLCHVIAKVVHGLKFPAGINVHEWKRRRTWIKSLAGKVQHYRAVLAHAIEHDRIIGLSHHLAHDVNTFSL